MKMYVSSFCSYHVSLFYFYASLQPGMNSFLSLCEQFKKFHKEIIHELEKKTDLDVKYMNVSTCFCCASMGFRGGRRA